MYFKRLLSLGRFEIYNGGMDIGEYHHRAEIFVGSSFPTSIQWLGNIYLFIYKLNLFLCNLNMLTFHILQFTTIYRLLSQFNEDWR